MIDRRLRVAFLCALVLGLLPVSASAQAGCGFALGFKAIHDQIPGIVGPCLENEHFNTSNGNAEQRTAAYHGKGGLLVWRKADNWTAFTDGSSTWLNSVFGLHRRPNDKFFLWEPDAFGKPRSSLIQTPDDVVARCEALPGTATGPLAAACFTITANVDKFVRDQEAAKPRAPLPAAPPVVSSGEIYRVNVTRKGQDLYEETSTRVLFRTRYCYEYVYYQDAIYDAVERKLIFEYNRCDVAGVYR